MLLRVCDHLYHDCRRKWIILIFAFVTIISHSGEASSSNRVPLKLASESFAHQNRTAKTFSIGPCTWVQNRTCPDADIKFFLFTQENPNERQYIHIDEDWESSNISESYFNPFLPNKIIIHGYNSDMFLSSLIRMKDEYLKVGDYNIFYVDWSILAPAPCYPMAVHNARHVGKCIAQLVDRILDIGNQRIHVIGFSLGAQVTNHVALNLENFRLPRITGLDPALPLYATWRKDEKLDPSDAVIVDVIHTNALVQGKIERCGHVDFYMNGGVLQPGCQYNHRNPFACSHQRAPEYFVESINSIAGFWGWACSSYINYLFGFCPPTNYQVIAGEHCKTDTRHGMYLINTETESPFALGKWTDINRPSLIKSGINFQQTNRDPFQEAIDSWGKLEGGYNNIDNFDEQVSESDDSHESNDGYAKLERGQRPNYDILRKLAKKKFPKRHNQQQTSSNSRINSKVTASDHSQFVEEYKRNLTKGIINPEVFGVPDNLEA